MPRVTSRRRAALAAAVCLAAVSGVASHAAALAPDARITTAGLGPLKIGMTVAEVERAGRREVAFAGADANAGCATGVLGARLFALFSRGRLVRIYVGRRGYATRTRIRVGDTQRKVLVRYGRAIARSPHKYVPGGLYLKLTVGNRRLVFETDGRRVTQISTGRKPEIDYVEGCS